MSYRSKLGAIALVTTLGTSTAGAQIFDYGKYPDFKGQWLRWGPRPRSQGPARSRRAERLQRHAV